MTLNQRDVALCLLPSNTSTYTKGTSNVSHTSPASSVKRKSDVMNDAAVGTSFISKFRAVNADSINNQRISASCKATRSLGHFGLPQMITRTRRPEVKNMVKKMSADQNSRSLSDAVKDSSNAMQERKCSLNFEARATCLQGVDDPCQSVTNLHDSTKASCSSEDTRVKDSETKNVQKGIYFTSCASASCAVPLSRSLLQYRPSRVLQGDRPSQFTSVALMQQSGGPHCAACGAAQVLYRLHPCEHLMCKTCITAATYVTDTEMRSSSVTTVGESSPVSLATQLSNPNLLATQLSNPNSLATQESYPNLLGTQQSNRKLLATQPSNPNSLTTLESSPNSLATQESSPNSLTTHESSPNSLATQESSLNRSFSSES